MDRAERRPASRRVLTTAAIVGLLVLAVAGLVRSAGTDGPVSHAERADQVAASLRCPTCQGLSVADSEAPLSQSMRDIIDEQVAAGRSNDEIRQYFVDRYGEWVLLAPPADGRGWVVWTVPAAAVLVGLLVVASLVRRRAEPAPETDPLSDADPAREAGADTEATASTTRGSQALRWVSVGGVLAASLGVLIATNLGVRGEGELATGNVTPLGSGTASEQADGSTESPVGELDRLRAAVEADPDDVRSRLALASTAFQSGRLDLARTQAEAALQREPRNVDALMLRGLAAESSRDRGATSALRSFLRLAPSDHPAVPLVRTLLEEDR